jgi:hypothetical protein
MFKIHCLGDALITKLAWITLGTPITQCTILALLRACLKQYGSSTRSSTHIFDTNNIELLDAHRTKRI